MLCMFGLTNQLWAHARTQSQHMNAQATSGSFSAPCIGRIPWYTCTHTPTSKGHMGIKHAHGWHALAKGKVEATKARTTHSMATTQSQKHVSTWNCLQHMLCSSCYVFKLAPIKTTQPHANGGLSGIVHDHIEARQSAFLTMQQTCCAP